MKDLFSTQSKSYAVFRPSYPKELYDFIFKQVNEFSVAWDAGCGNGQVAKDLAPQFTRVLATDISARQLENAVKAVNIVYSLAGETTSFADHTVDLITVGQAIHWFDRDLFYREVKRVGKPGGVLAVWGYGLLSIEPTLDKELIHFYTKIVGPYWDSERKLIDEHYTTIMFPFEEIETPEFALSFEWSLNELEGYLSTWSSVQKYINANRESPVHDFITKIGSVWGEEKKSVHFPLFLRLGRI